MRRRGITPIATTVAAACAALLMVAPASAVEGDLDPSFDGDGKVSTDFGSDFDTASDVAVDGDAKLVAVGTAVIGGGNDFAVARYMPNGALDTSFDGDGKATVDFSGFDTAATVVIQPDGKIVVAGRGGSGDFALARLNTDGSLDTGFSDDGRQLVDFNGLDAARDVGLTFGGRIVAGGGANLPTTGGEFTADFALVRLHANGALDTNFGGDGKVTTNLAGRQVVEGIAPYSDGRVAVVGTTDTATDDADLLMARYNDLGNLDTQFAFPAGFLLADFTGNDDFGFGIALQPDEKLVVTGFGDPAPAGGDVSMLVARTLSNGFLDSEFDNDGWLLTGFPGAGSHSGREVAIQPDGRVVVAGLANQGAGTANDFGLARFNENGTPDTSFSADGLATADLGDNGAEAMALQPDGKIVLAGPGGGNFALARFSGDETPPETEITNGPSASTNDSTPTFEFSSSEQGSSFA